MFCYFIVFAAIVFNSLAARVELDWNVGYVFGARDGYTYRRAIGVNGKLPFPSVHVMQGDTLVINVHNSLDVPTSIHTHGLFNNGTNYYDGPDMVTQCGIPPGENFTYVFETKDQFGTFWVHGHTRHQEADGFHTPLIIHSRKQPVIVYDEELTMTFEDWYTTEFYVRQEYIESLEDARTLVPNYPRALINGYDGNNTAPITFVPKRRYRLRIICMSLTVNKFIDKHHVLLNALSSSLYKPVLVPTLYTALSMGDLAKNSSVYGPQTNAYVLKHLEVVEIVINNPIGDDHTFHFHGHNVQVIETGPYGNSSTDNRKPVAHQQSELWPMWRDTVQVRAYGFIRVRFRADNPGVWFLHCHLAIHMYNGLAVVFVEAPDVLQQRQSVPEAMVEMCKRQGILTQGNGAGNQGFDLSGLPPAIYLPS
ncbi:ferroxidase fet3 [Coemansia sp. RSA 518]|nr:ferroxidase fet3 [Coemansia sp. RSA 518]